MQPKLCKGADLGWICPHGRFWLFQECKPLFQRLALGSKVNCLASGFQCILFLVYHITAVRTGFFLHLGKHTAIQGQSKDPNPRPQSKARECFCRIRSSGCHCGLHPAAGSPPPSHFGETLKDRFVNRAGRRCLRCRTRRLDSRFRKVQVQKMVFQGLWVASQ